MLNLYQESYFLYDRCNLIKQSFVKELNQFLPSYCSVSFFGEEKANKTKLISPENGQSFLIERDTKEEQLGLQITQISGEKLDTAGKQIHETLISWIEKKRKYQCLLLTF